MRSFFEIRHSVSQIALALLNFYNVNVSISYFDLLAVDRNIALRHYLNVLVSGAS